MEERKTAIQLKAELVVAADAAKDAMLDGESAESIEALKEVANKALEAYNAQATCEAYAVWAATEDPIKAMALAGYIPGILKLTFTKDRKSGLPTYRLAEKGDVKASLVDYMAFHGREAFSDKRWFDMVQKFAYVYAGNKNKALTGNKEFAYEVEEAAKVFEFAPDADPTSKRSVVKALQCCFNAIRFVGDGELSAAKADSHDIEMIDNSMTAAGKKRWQVSIRQANGMAEYIFDALSRHIVAIETDTAVNYELVVSNR